VATSKYNQRTIDYVRQHGFEIESVERYNAFTRRRSDLFNIVDYIGIDGRRLLGIQSTSYNHKSDHKLKILAEPATKKWLQSNAKLVLITWRKNKQGTRYLPADVISFELDVGQNVITRQLQSLGEIDQEPVASVGLQQTGQGR
jgi:hypothetical protein